MYLNGKNTLEKSNSFSIHEDTYKTYERDMTHTHLILNVRKSTNNIFVFHIFFSLIISIGKGHVPNTGYR